MFIFGVIFADLEMQIERPLDWFRNLSLAGTIVKNTILIAVVISYGSYREDCMYKDSGVCPFWTVVSFNNVVSRDIALYIGAISLILLALTSTVFQKVLGTSVFQFFGRISYVLYLVHNLFIFWLETDFVRLMHSKNNYL